MRTMRERTPFSGRVGSRQRIGAIPVTLSGRRGGRRMAELGVRVRRIAARSRGEMARSEGETRGKGMADRGGRTGFGTSGRFARLIPALIAVSGLFGLLAAPSVALAQAAGGRSDAGVDADEARTDALL